MGADMVIHVLYVNLDRGFDLVAATAEAERLIADASGEDLLHVVDGMPGGELEPDSDAAHDLPALRAEARTQLVGELRTMAESLVSRMVTSDMLGGVVAFMTGGPTSGDTPGAADDWDVLCADDRLPEGWADRIGHAAGLLWPSHSAPDNPNAVVFVPVSEAAG
jgi:hypothetical protein